MKIAIPVTGGALSAHFGHCEQFDIFDVDLDGKKITSRQSLTPPPHEPGILPQWLSGLQVELVIAGGMGQRAQQLFAQNNIDLIVGAADNTPQELIEQYMNNRLQTGTNICDH
ncbi:MAG: NifB/NifX family molybdenum-iron cluster-binding protein [Sedimentisphaerales bacterium]|nr:NifB/NifX family molybdenum-iron cluster-binding protein [Sedimentisphaerales bacterium]